MQLILLLLEKSLLLQLFLLQLFDFQLLLFLLFLLSFELQLLLSHLTLLFLKFSHFASLLLFFPFLLLPFCFLFLLLQTSKQIASFLPGLVVHNLQLLEHIDTFLVFELHTD